MPIKIIRVPLDEDFKEPTIGYQEPDCRIEGSTVRLTKARVDEHFRGRPPSEIIVLAWVPPAKGKR